MDPNYKKRGLNSNYNNILEYDKVSPSHTNTPLHGLSELGPLAQSWSKPSDDSKLITEPLMISAPMTAAQMTTAPVMKTSADGGNADSTHLRKIARSTRDIAGLTNPDGGDIDLLSMMTISRMKAP